MGRQSRTRRLIDSSVGQHLALSVAAGLARTQLVPDPLRVYDAQHLSEMLNVIAHALAKVTQLYVRERADAVEPRPLTMEEQETAEIRRGATVLVLKGGKTYSSVTIRRADLRQAVAVLKVVGIPEFSPRPVPGEPSAASLAGDTGAQLLVMMDEIELLVAAPLVATQVERANRLAIAMARQAPRGHVANLAMQLMSCLHESREADDLPERCRVILARLRAAVEDLGQPAG